MDATHRWLLDVVMALAGMICTGLGGWLVKRVGEIERDLQAVRTDAHQTELRIKTEISELESVRASHDIEVARTLGRIEQKIDGLLSRP